MFGHDTGFRQGDLAIYEGSLTTISGENLADQKIVIISHDCDIARNLETEPLLEIILANVITKEDPQLCHARNSRRLHLKYTGSSNDDIWLELTQHKKTYICKESFSSEGILQTDKSYYLPANEKRILKQWLASRYGRPAFPNEFERRLASHKNFERKLRKAIDQAGDCISGIFMTLDDASDVELQEGEAYPLRIIIVYDTFNYVMDESEETASQLSERIKSLFKDNFERDGKAEEIDLEECDIIAHTQFSFAQMKEYSQWRVEHLSLTEDGNGEFMEMGRVTG
ncbi:hypothetical protein ACUN8C_01670 [Kushneria sp. Sum13]|uniref:hypothetical protein n=1 Tax=Kushneria sp. Sum13 TaxID=3459196 RepID=UPI0040452D4C